MIKQIALSNTNRVQTTLWTLLMSTRHLHCASTHDRVYALLSISTSVHQGIRADYTVPVQSLLNRVLRNWHSYLRPSSLDEVSRQCNLLEDIFSLDRNSIYGLSSPDTSGTGSLLDYPRTFELKPKDCMHAKTWAEFYGHDQVCRLLHEATNPRGLPCEHLQANISTRHLPNDTKRSMPQSRGSRAQMSVHKVKHEPSHRETRLLAVVSWANKAISRYFIKGKMQNRGP